MYIISVICMRITSTRIYDIIKCLIGTFPIILHAGCASFDNHTSIVGGCNEIYCLNIIANYVDSTYLQTKQLYIQSVCIFSYCVWENHLNNLLNKYGRQHILSYHFCCFIYIDSSLQYK